MTVDCQIHDAILQTVDTGHAQRLILYHADEELRQRVYPQGGSDEFISFPNDLKAGTRSDCHHFVLLKRLTVSPLEFKQWLESSFITHVVTRIFFLGDQVANSKEALLQQLIAQGPPSGPVRLMCHPKSLQGWLAEELETHYELHPLNNQWTLHVFGHDPSSIRYQLCPANLTYLTRCDGPKRVSGQFCRAAGKLTEALEVSGLTHGSGAAVDIGASPGGWTVQLAQRFKLAIAIDPAEMHAEAMALSNVVHVKRMSQDAAEEVTAALAGRPVDLLCCDANKHPLAVIDMLRPLLSMLRPGGLLIVTLKFRGKGRDKEYCVAKTVDALGPEFVEHKCLWLTANTQTERTIVATRRSVS